MKPVADILAGVRDSLSRAYKALELRCYGKNVDIEDYDRTIDYFVERAFVETLVFLEAQGLMRTYAEVEALRDKAKQNYSEMELDSVGDPCLVWDDRLSQHLRAIENTLGESLGGTVSKDIVEILRGTQNCITDPCFGRAPVSERDVHDRIEAVLRCVFPNLVRKPAVSKGIKSFHADTGLPSIRTLIEYKFMTDKKDVGKVADEILADSRGYLSKDWDTLLFVVYETRRIKTEQAWNDMVRNCGLGSGARVIVIPGEPRDVERNVDGRRKITKRRKSKQLAVTGAV